ncbi:MAG TPA: 50S ribosomal protein L13 [Oligoflexia bacterium]|nr:50S ribosomal protein L13 [Oligoflexia bacterium]HMP27173.1 50S ribosomal protein L13 [Oligoflexia bacterium]
MARSFKTLSLSKEEAYQNRGWVLVDAAGETLGRLASRIATLLRGKHKAAFTKHVDCGDFVVVINAEKVRLSGNKFATKKYYSHSGHMGGLKELTAEELLQKSPASLIKKAVEGMLPIGPLGHQLLTKLKIYVGENHPHHAQAPAKVQLRA